VAVENGGRSAQRPEVRGGGVVLIGGVLGRVIPEVLASDNVVML